MAQPAGLLQGLPDGTEEDQLYQFEEEMEKNSVMLRHYKSSNEQVSIVTLSETLPMEHGTATASALTGRSVMFRLLSCKMSKQESL